MRLMIEFSYDGSKFHGFQRQNNCRSVQGDIENTLSIIYNTNIEIKGAGRTDVGVHAFGQTATFDVNYHVSGLKKQLNSLLKDIKIKKIFKVDDSFHARFSAKGKIYIYKIKLESKAQSPYFISLYNVDIKKMKEVAKLFVGKHDFSNFASGEKENFETFIYSIKFIKRSNFLYIKFKGAGFYRYMVRNLVGAMIDVGRGKRKIEEVKEAIENPDIKKQFSTALPNGLYLSKVLY